MERIKQFLQVIDDLGGDGSGYGSGYGFGFGCGSGCGSGSGFVISESNGIKIHNIDNIETGIIKILRENIAGVFIRLINLNKPVGQLYNYYEVLSALKHLYCFDSRNYHTL